MKKINPEIIVAVDCEGGFGKAGKIPWSLPEDLKHFKQITAGGVCVMGRNTYNNLLDMRVERLAATGNMDPITEILPGRESYIVTSDKDYKAPGAQVVSGWGLVKHRLQNAEDNRKLFVIGGERLFIQALCWVNTVHMTIVKGEPYNCDVFFPIQVLNKTFSIVSGKETEKAYYVVYQRK